MRNRVNYINKPDFLHVFYTTRTEAITLANIQSSFTAARLVLYNPERVLSKLYTQLKTLTLPSTSYTNNAPASTQAWAFKTPHDTAQLVLQANTIKRTALLTLTNCTLDQLVKGC
jgi:hypothetical protein